MALVWPWMVCFLLPFFHGAVALQFVVGGRNGWVVPSGVQSETYNQWAGRNRFLIRDTLLFNYNSAVDSVLHVTAQQYDACNTSSPIASYKGGKTVFTLARYGPFHFISGNRSNCQKGEKLLVVVLAPRNGSHGSPAPTIAASPGPSTVASSPSFAPAPAPTPTHKAPSSSPSPASTHKAPSSSPSPASVVSSPSPSSSPAPVGPVLSPSLSPTPSVSSSTPLSSPALSPPSPSAVTPSSSPALSSPPPSASPPPALQNTPTASPPPALQNTPTASPSPPSASPPALVSAKNLVIPLLFVALKILY